MNISKKLALWQKADLITARQMQDIQTFEMQNAKPYTYYGLLALSFFCIGIGVIALIAANWTTIPSNVKLGIDFILLATCAFGVYHAYDNNKMNRFDILVFLYALFIMATIGLIAQIFQLQPEGSAAYLLWAALVSPLLFYVRSSLLPIFWVPIAWFSFWDFVFDQHIGQNELQVMTESWFYSVPLIWLFLWALFYQSLGLSTQQNTQGLKKALAVWLAIFMGVVIYVMDKGYNFNIFFSLSGEGVDYSSTVFYGTLTATLLLTSFSFYLSYTKKRNYFLPYIMVLMLAGSIVHMYFVLSLLALLGAGVWAYKSGRHHLINLILVLTGIRIFIIYVDIFGSLMNTGFGLIGSGLVLLLIVWGWLKTSSVVKRGIKK